MPSPAQISGDGDREPSLQVTVDAMEKKYRNTVALDGVSMSIPEGVTCLLGRNGAGKSTLVRLLVGVEKPSAGRVTILHGETEVRGADKFARIGWLPQSFGFPARMGVEDFVSYAAWLKRVPRAGLAESVGSTLDLVDLRDSRHKRLGELSGGMLRRAGLAAAIVHRPSLLVLDEPTAGLDPVQRTDFHRRIAEIAKTTSVLLATHLLEDVQALGRFVSILDQGSLVWRGTAAELVETVDATGVTVDALRQALLRQIGVEFP